MEPHESMPYNPDIARVFYRMGYIETWGRGIQKICDACKELGADLPRYNLLGTGLRVYFKALESALIDQTKAPKDQIDTLDDTLENRIIRLISQKPDISQEKLSEITKMSIPTIKRATKLLADSGCIKRVGGKRYGHWEVIE